MGGPSVGRMAAWEARGAALSTDLKGYDSPCLMQEFAINLRNQASAIHEVPPPKSFTFLQDACRALEQARKVVAEGEARRGGVCRPRGGVGLDGGAQERATDVEVPGLPRCWPTPVSTVSTARTRSTWTW